MKKLWYILILTVLISCNTDKLQYFHTNYDDVILAAERNNKMIFIDFSTVWCGGCQFFHKNIMTDSSFASYMNENFYTLQIDAELETYKTIVENYKIDAYPTFIITDSEGKEIDRIVGLRENTPEKFIELLKNILKGNEQLDFLKTEYNKYPDSLNLFKNIFNKLLSKDLYESARQFASNAENTSTNYELKSMAKFNFAYASVRDPKHSSPKEMTTFVNEQGNVKECIEYGMEELFFYYRSTKNSDSVQFYLNKLIDLKSQNHFVYVRDYARFLYENNINIELADKFTNEYSNAEGNQADHWTPFLTAHSLAKHGKLDEGIEIFDNWMTKYSKPENFKEDYWHYRFYIDLILFYKIPSDNALNYAKKFETNNPSINNKKNLANIFYFNGDNNQAVEKLKEVKNMIEDPNKKKDIDELIKKYSKEN